VDSPPRERLDVWSASFLPEPPLPPALGGEARQAGGSLRNQPDAARSVAARAQLDRCGSVSRVLHGTSVMACEGRSCHRCRWLPGAAGSATAAAGGRCRLALGAKLVKAYQPPRSAGCGTFRCRPLRGRRARSARHPSPSPNSTGAGGAFRTPAQRRTRHQQRRVRTTHATRRGRCAARGGGRSPPPAAFLLLGRHTAAADLPCPINDTPTSLTTPGDQYFDTRPNRP
jgi:hypothetical protein